MKAALYARVSTKEGRQHLENQLRELRRYATAQHWTVSEVYTDEQTGADDDRPGLQKMLTAAARKKFDLVLIVELSRLTRGGPTTALKYVERLKSSGVELWSVREEIFRTSGPFGQVLIALVAWVAEQERATISKRVKAGLDRARASGALLGRRPAGDFTDRDLSKLQAQGLSLRQMAEALNVSKTTIQRRLLKCPALPPA